MSEVDTLTEPVDSAAALLRDASEGRLPAWAVATEERLAHMGRVAALMGDWAERLGHGVDESLRWRTAGWLHDALRDEDPARLRGRVPPELRNLPGALLHGPAAAERLRVDGVDDGPLLMAVACHTVGSEHFNELGRTLYAADFLEPGRAFLPEWRAELRERMPAEMDAVVFEIVQARIGNLLERGAPVLPQTMRFWNHLVEAR